MSHSSIVEKHALEETPIDQSSTTQSSKPPSSQNLFNSQSTIQQSPEKAAPPPNTTLKEESDNVDNDGDYPTGVRLLTVIAALVLAMLLAVMDMTILATAIPHITDQFHSLDDVGWYASAFFMTVASSQSTWGKAYKYFDLKTVFLITIALFELGSLICGVAQNSVTLIAGRAVTGYGAAGVLAGCYTIVAFAVRPEQRPAFTGVLAATYGVGSSIAPVIGGALADKVSWRWCFYINLPIGGVSVAIILLTFKTPPLSRNEKDIGAPWSEKLKQMDLIGTFTIMAAVICLLLALQWGGVSKSWSSADVIGTLVGFGLISGAFVILEYLQGNRALLVPHILKKRVVYVGCLVSFLLGGGEFTMIYYIPIYFQSILGVSAQESGVRNLAFIIAVTIFTVVSGAAITATGYFTPFIVLGAAMTTVGSGLMYTFSESSPSSEWIGYQVLAGIGIGLCFQAPIMAIQALADPEDVSASTAMVLFFQTMGGAFMVSGAQSAFTNTLVKNLATHAPGVDVQAVIEAGATNLRETFSGDELAGILTSYMAGLKVAFAIVIALTGGATVASLAMPWTSVKSRPTVAPL
ncbi:MFS gliotoxin efflux transporter gliA [Lasiodiplodia theobromae]|uniref:MFS gliotoxin efflux transporter gliA n=1 Tax=Lasiodiplodia theobromae TaxID=45133 RepID=A0A5N5D336_9PEZI|nr:MFS gliotoxin efflux transporter gliA [Lasiodiplodia theobromae]